MRNYAQKTVKFINILRFFNLIGLGCKYPGHEIKVLAYNSISVTVHSSVYEQS